MSNDAIAIRRAIVVSLGVIIPVLAQSGGGFDLTWSTLDGGGGATSAGGGYEVSGTVGQPDASAAGAMSGGNYALTGGFWGVALPACTMFVTPDFDQDCDVDGDDYIAFAVCSLGPAIMLAPGCEPKDLDADSDVDQDDFGIFQKCYSGEGNPADLICPPETVPVGMLE